MVPRICTAYKKAPSQALYAIKTGSTPVREELIEREYNTLVWKSTAFFVGRRETRNHVTNHTLCDRLNAQR